LVGKKWMPKMGFQCQKMVDGGRKMILSVENEFRMLATGGGGLKREVGVACAENG
jgi:hypothetical protein